MPSKPTFVEQERRDSCALACLRMLLAHDGVDVSESELLEEVAPLRGGLPLDEGPDTRSRPQSATTRPTPKVRKMS